MAVIDALALREDIDGKTVGAGPEPSLLDVHPG
jgi:hypothetical protein